MSLTPCLGFIEIGKESGVKPYCNRLNTLRLHLHTYLLNTNFSQFRNIFLQSLPLLLRFNLLLQFRVSSPGLLFAEYCVLFREWFYLFCILKALINAFENSDSICFDLFLMSSKLRKNNISQIYFLTNKKFIFSLVRQIKLRLKNHNKC